MNDNSNLKAGHDYNHKSTDSARLIQSVRKLFLSGGKYSARTINSLCEINDARKFISILRNKEGWNIVDCRMPDGCKLYWLREHDDVEPYFKTAAELAAEVRKMVYDNLTKTEPTK